MAKFFIVTKELPELDYDLLHLKYSISACRLPINYFKNEYVELVYYYSPGFNLAYKD